MDTGENNSTAVTKIPASSTPTENKLSLKHTIFMILALTPNHTFTFLELNQPLDNYINLLSIGFLLFYLIHSWQKRRSSSDESWADFLAIVGLANVFLSVCQVKMNFPVALFGGFAIFVEAVLLPCYLKRFIGQNSKKAITIGVILTSLFITASYSEASKNLLIHRTIETLLRCPRLFAVLYFKKNSIKVNKNLESFENLTPTPFLQQLKLSCIITLSMSILGIATFSHCLTVMTTFHLLALIPKFTLLESIPIVSSLTLTLVLPIFLTIGLNSLPVRFSLLIFLIISFAKTAYQSSTASSNQRTSSYLAKLDQKRKLNEQQQIQEQTIPTQKTKSSSNKTTNTFSMTPIGYIENSCYPDKFGVPRQPKLVPDSYAIIKLNPPYDQAECVRSLEVWSHVWVTFIFHESPEKWTPLIRPPRLGGNAKVGVFASRSTHRPNRLGLSLVEVVKIDTEKGVKLHIKGHDLINGTPVLDVKPYIPWGDRGENARAGYALAPPEELPVIFMPEAEEVLKTRKDRDILEPLIIQVMQQDPRPAYKSEEAERRFGVYLYDLDVRFRILEEDGRKVVKVVEIVKSQFAKD